MEVAVGTVMSADVGQGVGEGMVMSADVGLGVGEGTAKSADVGLGVNVGASVSGHGYEHQCGSGTGGRGEVGSGREHD